MKELSFKIKNERGEFMKKYTKPAIYCVEIRAEERLAAAVCDNNGACDGFVYINGVLLDANENGIADGWTLS